MLIFSINSCMSFTFIFFEFFGICYTIFTGPFSEFFGIFRTLFTFNFIIFFEIFLTSFTITFSDFFCMFCTIFTIVYLFLFFTWCTHLRVFIMFFFATSAQHFKKELCILLKLFNNSRHIRHHRRTFHPSRLLHHLVLGASVAPLHRALPYRSASMLPSHQPCICFVQL
ncbi:hypothetical protein PBCV1_a478aL [Paramecium bursaria Chlorella virus 1]|uniref:Uncharacterized protein n=1 Tax=Paramecium bursaria Chlorella virus 1 TaxID=10506 RepID=Q98529_PBCV1|nr:hypothetical protein PBCV1_a478aL [Paramecium bursaria Chlorella virus 1]AAC96846.2 hypothetical protein [Paramecium bursaria Chlorella virus 1]